eukprot:1188782-Prorocentrum_minimum.AAC.1
MTNQGQKPALEGSLTPVDPLAQPPCSTLLLDYLAPPPPSTRRTAVARHLRLGDVVLGVALEARVVHFGDLGVRLQAPGQLEGGIVLALDAQLQRLHAAQHQVRRVRINHPPKHPVELAHLPYAHIQPTTVNTLRNTSRTAQTAFFNVVDGGF